MSHPGEGAYYCPMMRVLFPEIQLPEGVVLGERLDTPRQFIANPKAVAAQTFASPAAFKTYLASGLWRDMAQLFAPQYAPNAPLTLKLDIEGEAAWLAFPWAVKADLETAGTLVWLEKAPDGQDVRHLRVYSSADQAHRDNAWLQAALAAITA